MPIIGVRDLRVNEFLKSTPRVSAATFAARKAATKIVPEATWRLTNLDSGKILSSGFPPGSEIVEAFGSNISTTSPNGSAEPIQQWVSGELNTLTLDLYFYARHMFEQIDDKIRTLKQWATLDYSISPPRQPVLFFSYGPAFQLRCILDKVSSARWSARVRWPDQRPRACVVSVTLRRYVADTLYVATDPNALEQSTKYHIVADGETYEHIAAKRYGESSTLYGVLLRQDHPESPEPQIGQRVEVPDLEKIQRRAIEPEAAIFKRDRTARAALNEYWVLRSR